ncbi:MAG TPA: hypothetical protein VHC22_00755 [Pirellulales bacterium]|nr:hypothetical protein [Pirellulales bacterium]
MNLSRPIAGVALLLLMAAVPSVARGGLMASDAIFPADGVDVADTGPADAMTAATRETSHDSESPIEATLKRVAAQPAQNGAGATGSGTTVASGGTPVAILAPARLPRAVEPVGFCIELKNSQLPLPPTADLLRPPRHAR